MSFGPSAKTPPRHLGPAPRRGWAADAAAEPQIRVEPRRTSTGDDMSPPSSPITGGWFRSRLSGDGSHPESPETRPESPFSLGGLAARAGDALRADNEALFRQGLFNAVGNAILLLLVGLLYAVSSLLSQYRAPILWAVLVSLALRDVKVALVRFWTDQLTRHTLAGVALAPARAAAEAARRAKAFAAQTVAAVTAKAFTLKRSATPREPPLETNGGRSVSSELKHRPSRSRRRYMSASAGGDRPAAGNLRGANSAPETADASTFHFRWLFFLGCATETYAMAARDWDLTRSVVALGAVLCAAAFVTTGVVVAADFYLFKRAGAFGSPFVFVAPVVAEENRRGEGDAAAFAERRGADADAAGAFEGGPATDDAATDRWTETETNTTIVSRAMRLYLRLDLAIRRLVLANLHALVATGLIVGGIALAAAVAAFFTVNVARESAEAVALAREAVLEGGSRVGGAGLGGLTRQIRDARGAEGRWRKELSSAVETHWPRVLRFARAKAEEAFPEANATEVWEAMQHLYLSAQEAATGGGAVSGDTRPRTGGNVNVSSTAILRAGKMLGDGDVAGAVAAAREVFAAVASDASARSPLRVLLRVGVGVSEALRARASVILAGSTKGVGALVSLASSLFASAFGVAGATASFFLKCAVFFTALFHVLASEADPATRLVELFPLNDRVKAVAVHSVTKGVRGVFVSCLKLALFHAAFTWVTFRLFNVHFVYTSTLASAMTAILPLLASWSVSLPAAFELVAKGQAVKGLGLVVAHWVTLVFVDIDIYQTEIKVVHPYVVGLSVVGGMVAFQPAPQGAILGPLLVTALATGHTLYQELVRTPPEGSKHRNRDESRRVKREPGSVARRRSEGNGANAAKRTG